MPSKVLILFHRDLRTEDHNGIETARKNFTGAKLVPIFIFTHQQIDNAKNPYKSSNSVRFMIESLEDLHEQTSHTLSLFYGDTLDVLQKILTKDPDIIALVETADYTPFALKRQQEVRGLCALRSIAYHLIEDIYLTEPGTVLNAQGRMFQKFTPFWESARRRQVARPASDKVGPSVWQTCQQVPGVEKITLQEARSRFIGPANRLGDQVRHGGRQAGLKLLANLPENYDKTRDCLAIQTSRLSAHNHYGTVSIREVYWTARDASRKHLDEFVRQLYWRDFYGHICYAFDTLYGVNPYDFWTEADTNPERRKKAMGPEYTDPKIRQVFEAWTRGETGKEVVDAAMRQLLAEGFIHGRARLTAADYLVKGLGVPWRWGERWYAQHLVDYDFAQNFGNWCWVASVLPFSQAPFRRHNPERIQERLDPGKNYIQSWLNHQEGQEVASK